MAKPVPEPPSLTEIRRAIMLLVEVREMYIPKEGHFAAHINARIDSLKKFLPAPAQPLKS